MWFRTSSGESGTWSAYAPVIMSKAGYQPSGTEFDTFKSERCIFQRMAKAQTSSSEPLDHMLSQLRELSKRGVRFYIDTIEGELPPQKLEELRRLMEEG